MPGRPCLFSGKAENAQSAHGGGIAEEAPEGSPAPMSTGSIDTTAHSPIDRLGEIVFDAVSEIGDVAQFSVVTLGWMLRKRPRWSTLVPNFYAIGVSSVPVV